MFPSHNLIIQLLESKTCLFIYLSTNKSLFTVLKQTFFLYLLLFTNSVTQ